MFMKYMVSLLYLTSGRHRLTGSVHQRGTESDAVAGIEATKYLETRGVPILANPSTFLAKNKLGLQLAAMSFGLRVPQDTLGRYPKIVKYADSYGSLKLDYESICHSEQEALKRVAYLMDGNESFRVTAQDYIIGT